MPPKAKEMRWEDRMSHSEMMGRIWAMLGATIAVGGSAAYYAYGMGDRLIALPEMPDLASRGGRRVELLFALRCEVGPVSAVLCCIALVVRVRKSRALNPTTASSQAATDVPQRILQNTLEQYVMHVASVLILTSWLDESQMSLVAIIDACWCTGRVLFAVAYLYHPFYRTPGFALTFFPTVLSVLYSAYRLYLAHGLSVVTAPVILLQVALNVLNVV